MRKLIAALLAVAVLSLAPATPVVSTLAGDVPGADLIDAPEADAVTGCTVVKTGQSGRTGYYRAYFNGNTSSCSIIKTTQICISGPSVRYRSRTLGSNNPTTISFAIYCPVSHPTQAGWWFSAWGS